MIPNARPRGAAVTHTHVDRDEIKSRAEADFLNLYLEYGGRRRGKALHFIFHADRTPSARIRAGRFHCFGCNISLDVFAFVAKVERTDFKGALSFLADRYGVPLNTRTLTDAERRKYGEARRIREDAAYFVDAAFRQAAMPAPATVAWQSRVPASILLSSSSSASRFRAMQS